MGRELIDQLFAYIVVRPDGLDRRCEGGVRLFYSDSGAVPVGEKFDGKSQLGDADYCQFGYSVTTSARA
ncbi:hypothetical protein [Croceibacterium xixiisoli]|uniref:hypothetical protein n=1 Tax=Croceibacterium xixiisoli TaxID=1476466 RepID=UPI00136B909F|nr:hypothetical protein [Croceibacterium xixiisoli]